VRGIVHRADEFDAARDLGDLAVLDEGRELAVDVEHLQVVEGSLARGADSGIGSGRSVLRLALAGVGRSGPAHAEVLVAGVRAKAGLGLKATAGGRELGGFLDRSRAGRGGLLGRGGKVGGDTHLRAQRGLGGAVGLGGSADGDLARSTAKLADELAGDGLPIVDLALGDELGGGLTGRAQAALDAGLCGHLAGRGAGTTGEAHDALLHRGDGGLADQFSGDAEADHVEHPYRHGSLHGVALGPGDGVGIGETFDNRIPVGHIDARLLHGIEEGARVLTREAGQASAQGAADHRASLTADGAAGETSGRADRHLGGHLRGAARDDVGGHLERIGEERAPGVAAGRTFPTLIGLGVREGLDLAGVLLDLAGLAGDEGLLVGLGGVTGELLEGGVVGGVLAAGEPLELGLVGRGAGLLVAALGLGLGRVDGLVGADRAELALLLVLGVLEGAGAHGAVVALLHVVPHAAERAWVLGVGAGLVPLVEVGVAASGLRASLGVGV